MKQFFSILCALVLAATINATTADQQARQRAEIGKQIFMAQRMNNGIVPGRFAAPKATKEVYDLTILKDYSTYYSMWSQQFSISMYSEDHAYDIRIYINLPEGQEVLENGKTYTYADFDSIWSSVTYDPINFKSSGLRDGEITWTKDADSLVHFAGFVSDTLGNTYPFHYDEKAFAPTGDTISIACIDEVMTYNYSEWSACWSISFKQKDYYVSFQLNSENDSTPVGNYTEADFADYGNSIIIGHGHWSETLEFIDAKLSIFEENDTLFLLAQGLCDDGNVYAISAYYADPKPLYAETIKSTTMEIDSAYAQWGSISFSAANDEYIVRLSMSTPDYSAFDSIYGTFVQGNGLYANISKKLSEDETQYIETFSGSVTVAPEGDKVKITGQILCRNNVLYTLDLISGDPGKNREESITITSKGLYLYPDQGKFIVWVNNEDSSRIVSLSVVSDEVAGTYTLADMEENNTYVGYNWDEMGHVTEIYKPLSANLTVTYDEATKTAHVTGTMLAKSSYTPGDVPEFTLDITATLDKPKIDYDAETADFIEEFAEYDLDTEYILTNQAVIVEAYNETSVASMIFYMTSDATTFVSGTYNIGANAAAMTVTTGGVEMVGERTMIRPAFFAHLINGNIVAPLWFPVEGTVTVDDNKVITVNALNSYDRQIKVTLNPGAQAVEKVQNDKVQSTKVIRDGQLLIIRGGKTFNAQGVQL